MYNAELLQLLCFSFVVINSADGSFFVNNTRIRRQANTDECDRTQFTCKNGECIQLEEECDGAVDCNDASDESNACHRIKCPKYLFKCSYGACINANLECDGKPDCRDGSDEKTDKCKNVLPSCGANEFRCSSGECIKEELKCDGVANCRDKSDEIRATCWNRKCPGYTYRCKYGACVDGFAKCNGKIECDDASDEDPVMCNKPLPTPAPVTPSPVPGRPGSCVLPEHPQSGKWAIVSGIRLNPGTPVEEGTILEITCNRQHILQGDNFVFCKKGQWSNVIGICLKTCPDFKSSATTFVTCQYSNGEKKENCTNAGDGSVAFFQCNNFYEHRQPRATLFCRDGSWDIRQPECVPVCGQKTVDATTLIVGGGNVKQGEYPWQAALYTKKDKVLICGGSLINQKLILTAAHCVTHPDKATLLPKEEFEVAVGKYYRNYDDERDKKDVQFSAITAIYIPPQYGGAVQNYQGDIAILETVATFVLSRRVQPVCVDWEQSYAKEILNPQKTPYGYVTGWGYTVETGKPSDVLKELKVPAVTLGQCLSDITEDYHKFLTYDKLCAGYLDNGTSACNGDSGGGLVFKHERRYYIHGIVSLSPKSPITGGGCNSQTVGLYTTVDPYQQFLLQQYSRFKAEDLAIH